MRLLRFEDFRLALDRRAPLAVREPDRLEVARDLVSPARERVGVRVAMQ